MSKNISEIRQIFLDFFCSKGHQVIESSSLVPNNDSTLLFTNAGMNQFKNVFLGLESCPYRRATTSQRCVRVGGKHNDLENIGYTARHHTFFEMLGNFSFSDYFKHEAIQFAWELLTSKNWFNLPKEKFWVTVYNTDNEAYNIWVREIGFPAERITCVGDNKGSAYASDNFWRMGNTGPCGPCSEIFYDHGEHIWGGPPGSLEESGDRYIEIWNLVFMQFNCHTDGTLLPLQKPSVDTGMGLERISAVLQHVSSIYHTDLFKKIISSAAWIIGVTDLDNKSLRIIADHIRSCVFLLADGILPSNEGRGYVLRRIIRRAVRHGNILGATGSFFYKLVAPLIEVMGTDASQLKPKQEMLEKVLRDEEAFFSRTLARGLVLLDKELSNLTGNILDGDIAFRMYDTYGFPLDLTADICREHNFLIDEVGFKRAMEAQRTRSRELSNFKAEKKNFLCINQETDFCGYEHLDHVGKVIALFHNGRSVNLISQEEEAIVILNETPFYGESGGQVGDRGTLKATSGLFEVRDTQKYGNTFFHYGRLSCGELKIGMYIQAKVDSVRRMRICLNHSATHLLHAALRQVLGEKVTQRGSFVSDQYLRFDFSHNEAMKFVQIRRVENIVNQQIRQNLLVQTNVMKFKEACRKGATALFDKKYDTQVRVISMGYFSVELCGGTHVTRTGDIGLFHIISESGNASGVRRIQAVTGEKALSIFHRQSDLINQVSQLMKCEDQQLVEKIQILREYSCQIEKDLQKLKKQQVVEESTLLSRDVRNIRGVKILVKRLDNTNPKLLRTIVNNLKKQLQSAIIILATVVEGKITLVVGVTEDLTNKIQANKFIKNLSNQIGGKGGGRPDLAQAGGNDIAGLSVILKNIDEVLLEKLLS